MTDKVRLRTPICDLLGIEYPIILAGMGPVSHADLVAAVSNAGGLGVVGRSTSTGRRLWPDELRARIRRVRELTDKPFGVDLLLPSGVPETGAGAAMKIPQSHLDYLEKLKVELGIPEAPPPDRPSPVDSIEYHKDCMRVICEERVPIFASGLGLPEWVVPMCHEAGMKIISLVGNVKNARRVAALGADIIGAQGHDAGGHTGRIGTFSLIPQAVDAVAPVPVLAAGGIGDGRGLVAALALGAVGAWVGTAFLATKESPVHPKWKQKILEMNEEGTAISKSISGKTARYIRNRWIDLWEQSGMPTLPFPYQFISVGDILRTARVTENMDYFEMPTGQIGGMVHEIRPAGDVVRSMVAEAAQILSNMDKPLRATAKPAR